MCVRAICSLTGGSLLLSAACAAEFEARPAPYQTAARPADGETLSANPPCFVYPAERVRKAYVVEFSPSPAFPRQQTTRLESPYMLACPAVPLPAGRYHWRWQPIGADEWSAVRAFTVPEDVPSVPFPDIAALISRIRPIRPRVFANPDTLPALRERAQQEFGDGWLERVRRKAVQASKTKLLPEPDFLPDRNDPRRRALYQQTFRTTRPFFREMARLAEDFLLTGEPLAGQEAKRRLLHIVSWDPRGSTGINHNDEPGTEVVRYCPTAYDRVYSLLTEDEKARCVECLTIRMREMRARWQRRPFEKHPYESHNMGYYLPDLLEASLAMMGDAPVEEMLRYTMLQLWSPFYPPYGGRDGGWTEGPNYWGWSASVFARTYKLVESVTGVPIHERSALMRNTSRYKLYGNPPYFKMSPFGDGQEKPAGGGEPMLMLAALYRDPYAKWYAQAKRSKLQGMAALLFDTRDLEAKPPYDLPQGHAFSDVGLAAMHSVLPDPASNVAMLLRSCPFGSISHAYADQNAFALDAYGEPLLVASGYYQLYGSPHHAQWTWETKASNSVLVDGEGQATRDWDARGRLASFQTTVAGDYVVGDAAAAYKDRLKQFDRRIVFLRPALTGGEPIVVIRDELAAAKPATYQFLLHSLNKMRVAEGKQRVTVSRRNSRCRVDFLAPRGLAFEQTDQFPVAPVNKVPSQWHLTASTVDPAAESASLIVIQPYRASQSGDLLAPVVETGKGCIGVRLTGGERSVTVLFRTDPGAKAVELGELVTDAQAASVCTVKGRTHAAVQFGGSQLALAQRPLLTNLSAWTGAASPSSVGQPAPLQVEGQAPVPFRVKQHKPVCRVTAEAVIPGPAVHWEARAEVDNMGKGRLPVVVSSSGAFTRRVLVPGEKGVEIVLSPVVLGGESGLEIMGDEALGGRLVIRRALVRRVLGVNLLPHASFERVESGRPVGWRAGTITKQAQCTVASAPAGRAGTPCLRVDCTKATGGDFSATLSWPGIAASGAERRFRMGCWVKTDAASVAGLQVSSHDWRWYKNTPRLHSVGKWTEATVEFVLPAGQDLRNLRLHMSAEKTDAVLYVDDVSLVELPR